MRTLRTRADRRLRRRAVCLARGVLNEPQPEVRARPSYEYQSPTKHSNHRRTADIEQCSDRPPTFGSEPTNSTPGCLENLVCVFQRGLDHAGCCEEPYELGCHLPDPNHYTDAQSTIQAVEKTTVQVSAGQASPWRTTWQTPTSTGIVCVLDAVSRS